jgi:hypothetical protein
MQNDSKLSRVAQWLDLLTENGPDTLQRLTETDESLSTIAQQIARGPRFERLYKEARTLNIGSSARKDAEPALVGIRDLDTSLPFDQQFARYYRPRLEKRAQGFECLIAALSRPREGLVIVETGSLRVPGNWAGDGQSSFLFDALVRDRGGTLVSIDVTLESLDAARRVCSSAINLVLGDSVATLHNLGLLLARRIDLLYLDSFDLDPDNPMPSAIHHAMELMAARALIGPGTIVAIDDYHVEGSEVGGKALIIDQYLERIRAPVLFSGYQKVWQLV